MASTRSHWAEADSDADDEVTQQRSSQHRQHSKSEPTKAAASARNDATAASLSAPKAAAAPVIGQGQLLEGGFVMEELDLSDEEEDNTHSGRGGKRSSGRQKRSAKGEDKAATDAKGDQRGASGRRRQGGKAAEETTPSKPARRNSQSRTPATESKVAVDKTPAKQQLPQREPAASSATKQREEPQQRQHRPQPQPQSQPQQRHPATPDAHRQPRSTAKTPASSQKLVRTPIERVDSSDADTSFELEYSQRRRREARVASEDDELNEMAQMMEAYQSEFDKLLQEA